MFTVFCVTRKMCIKVFDKVSFSKFGSSEIVPSQTQSTVTLHLENKKDGNYDPLEHRKLAHPTSTSGAFFHLLKSSLGSGLFSMPAAFKHTGIIPGCIATAVVGFIATHCVQILVTTSRNICKECNVPCLSYTETCEKVFKYGPKGVRPYSNFVRHFADYAMAGVCLGGTSVYVVLIAATLKDVCDPISPYKYSLQEYCGFLLLPLILITQIRHLKFLVPFSLLANISLVVTFGITCFYTFTELPNVAEAKLARNVLQWPLFLSTAIFAMEGINVVMPVENEMAHPGHFLGCPGVLNVTMIFTAALYGVVGLFGYLKYGDNVADSVVLNLPKEEILALTAKILVAVAVFFTYCLQMYAPMDIIWTRLKGRFREKYHNLAQILQRTFCVGLTVILAIAVQDLGRLIDLVGAIFFSTLGLFIPVTIETVYKWERGLGLYNYVLWKNGLILLFYIIVLVSGCYSSISGLIDKYGKVS